MRAEENEAHVRVHVMETVGHLEHVRPRHLDIKQNYVGPDSRNFIEQICRRGQVSDALDLIVDGKLRFETFHEDCVIVNAQHAHSDFI